MSQVSMPTQAGEVARPVSPFSRRNTLGFRWLEKVLRFIRGKPLASLGGFFVLVMGLLAIFADIAAPHDPLLMYDGKALLSPGGEFWLGSDPWGRDVLSRIIYGARVSMSVGLGAVCISGIGATLLGSISAYVGGRLDTYVQRVVDAVMAIPDIVLLLTIMAVLGPGALNIILALAFRNTITQSRIVRSAVLGIKEQQYIEAARALGATDIRVLGRHVFPNIVAPVIVILTVSMGWNILAEASLSFLGYGVPLDIPTWGNMLSRESREYMMRGPWIAIFPGLALSLVVWGINMFGDGLRDVLDPRLRGSSAQRR
ncbi:MAG: ABC transporter permease [Chloroflexi bacterium]|nr:ABC transporter permease [Chloroflexota bacterium]